jgi:predicted dinucleotide-binding enzyme
MQYSIIGSGAIGQALLGHFNRAQMDIVLANSRGPTSLEELSAAAGSGVKPATVQEALRADLVILAVPFAAVSEVFQGSTTEASQIVVDATNAIDFPSFKPKDLGGRPSTAIVGDAAGQARVVKAFNTLPAALLSADPASDGGARVVFISGDEPEANGIVAELVRQLGFAPVVLGRLSEGGLLQQFGSPLAAQNFVQH